MFDGKLLRPVVISSWSEIARFQSAVLQSPDAAARLVRQRPSLRISLFWGPVWNDYVEKGRPLSALRPEQADQHGRFYPAWRGKPAVVDLRFAEHGPKRVGQASLAILARYGIPIRLEVAERQHRSCYRMPVSMWKPTRSKRPGLTFTLRGLRLRAMPIFSTVRTA